MANSEFARGLFPLRYRPDCVHAYRVNTATDVYLGMPVALDGNGEVAPLGVNTAGWAQALGVVVGFQTEPAGMAHELDPFLDVSDIPAGTIYSALVLDDPLAEYVCQEDTGGTALTQADAGTVAALIFLTGSGNTTTGWTNLMIDRSTVVTTTAGQVQLLRIHQQVQVDGTNNAPGNFCNWVVRLVGAQKITGAVAI